MGESKIVVLRLESTDRSTACLVQRAGGFVFLVGKYRNGLKEDLWYTWRIFQDVVRRQLRINGARVPISLHVDSPSPSGEDEREDSDGAPRKPLKSMTELFSKSSGTVVNVRVSTGKSDQASKLPVTQAIAADDNDAARKALGEEGGVDLDKNIHTRSLPAIVDVHIGPAEPHSTASASFADPASETVQSEADSVRRPHRVSIERNLVSEEEIIERHQQERRATLGLARAQHSMEHQNRVQDLLRSQEAESSSFVRSNPGRSLPRPLSAISTGSTSSANARPASATGACRSSEAVQAQVPTRNIVTVNYRSSRRLLRRRSFREKKVHRQTVCDQVNDILTVLDQPVAKGEAQSVLDQLTPTGDSVSAYSDTPSPLLMSPSSENLSLMSDVFHVPPQLTIPDPPSGLTIAEQSEDTVKLFWNPVSVDRDNCSNGHQVVGYTVFVDGQTEALVEGVDICTVELLELPNKTVHITVRTRCTDIDSLPSEPLRYTRQEKKSTGLGVSDTGSPAEKARTILIAESSPADSHLSPFSIHSADLGSEPHSISGRTSRSSSSGIGTDCCPSPSADHTATAGSGGNSETLESTGWIDEPLSSMHEYFLKPTPPPEKPAIVERGRTGRRSPSRSKSGSFRRWPSLRRRPKHADKSACSSALAWDPCYDSVSGVPDTRTTRYPSPMAVYVSV